MTATATEGPAGLSSSASLSLVNGHSLVAPYRAQDGKICAVTDPGATATSPTGEVGGIQPPGTGDGGLRAHRDWLSGTAVLVIAASLGGLAIMRPRRVKQS